MPVIERDELIRVVDEASSGLTQSTRDKLLAVAETTDAVAVGWFQYEGVCCPARQARRRNQRFQEAFDRAMAERFGREPNPETSMHFCEPFVVRVRDAR